MAAAVSSGPQHCGFCRDAIQDGAIQYVEQAMCKKILFWLSDLDSKFNAFDLQQITSNWCQVCFGLSAIVVQNLCDLGERISPRLAVNQISSSMSHTNSVKQEHRSSIAGSMAATTTTSSSHRALAFNPPSSVALSGNHSSTAFYPTVSLAQSTLGVSHPAQFMAGTGMKAAPTTSHMSMAGPGVPMLGPGGAGGLSMVTPMMAHGSHLQTIAVNGLPCQPFYTRPEMVSHPARAPSGVSGGQEEKPIKNDSSHQLEQGEKIPKPKKTKRKKTSAQTNGNNQGTINHSSAEGFSGEFDGTWADTSNFANIAQSFGLMPKGEEHAEVGGATGEVTQVNLMEAGLAGNNANTSPGKKGKKESMKFHKCFACDKQFTSQKWVRKHMEEKHNIIATFNCETCGKKFNDRKNFRRHCRLHSEDTPYKCTICGKKCGRNKDLRNHMASHQSEKNFQCTVCGKGYKAMKALRDHMKAHEGGAPSSESGATNSGSPMLLQQQQQRETMSAPPPSNNNQQTNNTHQPSLAQELIDTTGQQHLAMTLQNQVLMDPHTITSHAALLQQRYAETFRTTNLVDLAQTVVALHNPPPQSHTQGHR